MFRSGILVMIVTLISRVLGLARSMIVAYYFGATAATDAFFSAFKISNFFRQLLGEGALGTSFIPLYNEKIKEEGEEEGRKFIFSILNIIFIFSIIISLLMIIFSEQIIALIVNGFSPETRHVAAELLEIMSPYFILIAIAGMLGAILNNFKIFVVPASTAIFFNIAILGSAVYFGKTYGIKAMAYGVLVGGILQLLVQIPQFIGKTKGYSFKIYWKDKYLKRLFYMMLPMLVGIVARQFNTIVDQFFASYLEAGGISALENATRLYTLPIGVFGISVSTVVYPTLSKKIVNKDFKGVEDNLLKGLNILLFLIVPCMAVFCFYSKEIVKFLFGYGNFNERAIVITGEALFFYSVGLYFYNAIHVLTRAFYGMKNSKDPVKFSIMAIIINIVLNMILIKPMAYKGLALATSIAAIVNFTLLLYTFRKKYINFKLKRLWIFGIKTIIASIIGIISSFYINNVILKLVVFSVIYLILWAYPIYKKRLEVF
ncbi:murein biosynthesis integral membrane protein MurJ [Fusobacterium perfoetens]|uniref:murein biosynthesis integral membrane protein MurJ n=1 Tax=Fusobacterium perfoetens TaxID=852 RepID=UPI0004878452|nr:murein biosynthesis integral membrane protein MurJ [Fusobacterium perfoetens]MCI6153428.1 murein biosynthesis integral membrane protein MurJ [Fusobacterium perfoetens]MDY3238429.1 murein biosynthesis integral membrane protein MurJ [Fusobacterium perfoetens]